MPGVISRSTVLFPSLALLAFSGPPARQNPPHSDLAAHEWGTFTSVAGRTGECIQWLPRSGLDDLPKFVEHFRTGDVKRALRGTVRMETPVIYFYSPAETTVSVKVGFSKGVITEWYPHASRVEPDPQKILDESALLHHGSDGAVEWKSVAIEPGLAASFPRDGTDARYYAARRTSAAPLVVGTGAAAQQEKFLFYRGVAAFPVPVVARPTPDGKVLVRNLSEDEIPGVILFERRGDKLGYRLGGTLSGGQQELSLETPELTSTMESVSHELEGLLTTQGLYPDEARAMLETWRSSWFEEGSRLIYIVPRHFEDGMLPLSIKPTPSQIVRVFVGRVELITPATEHVVEQALASGDRHAITVTYARFLEPIMEQMTAEHPERAKELGDDLSAIYTNSR